MDIQKLRQLMRERELGINTLADKAKIGRGTASEILSGKRKKPRYDTVSKIAIALGISTDDFMNKGD